MDQTPLDRIVVALRDPQLRGAAMTRLLEEIDGISAQEVVLDVHEVPADLLPCVATLTRLLTVKRPVKLAGLRGGQVHQLVALGIGRDVLLIGRVGALG